MTGAGIRDAGYGNHNPDTPDSAPGSRLPSLGLWPFFLLVALFAGAVLGGAAFGALLVLWGLVTLLALVYGGAREGGLAWQPLVFFAVLALPALLLARLDISAALVAPVAVLMLPTLLGRHDTAASAVHWLTWVGWGLWALAGALSLNLLGGAGGLSSAAIVLAGLIGYNAGRRALLIQGRKPVIAHYAGAVVAALGVTLLAPPGDAALYAIIVLLGLSLYYSTEHMLPEVAPAASRQALISAAVVAVQQQLVCTAPLALAALWLIGQIRTYFGG